MQRLARIWQQAPWSASLAVGGAAASAGLVVTADDPRQMAHGIVHIPLRLGRDVGVGAAILADYQWNLRGLEGDAWKAAAPAVHQRSADRVVALAGTNGGVYLKAAQHLGQLDHLLPPEYTRTFRAHVLDRCPVSALAEVRQMAVNDLDPPPEDRVRQMVVNDLGAPPEDLFASFDADPIASASLAQVHRAVGHDGRKLAVKIQHAGIREGAVADVATIGLAVDILRYFAPDYDFCWVVNQTRENLPLELDFEHEAGNITKCGALINAAGSRVCGRVALPQVVPRLSSKRVLTMTFEEGVSLNDAEGLAAMGANPAEVAKLISEAFSEMLFGSGFVHCDPHAANMLVRLAPPLPSSPKDGGGQQQPHSTHLSGSSASAGGGRQGAAERAGSAAAADAPVEEGQPQQRRRRRWPWQRRRSKEPRLQLVLLDHGLYRQLDDDFRLNYARLWRSLVTADEAGIRAAATSMNAGDAAPLFAGMLTQRPWDQVVRGSADHLRVGSDEAERERLNNYARQFARDSARLLQRVPTSLLLLLKTNDCLRSVDAALGQPVNTFYITARACNRALTDARSAMVPGFGTAVKNVGDRLWLEWRLTLFRAAMALAALRARLTAARQQGMRLVGLAPAAEDGDGRGHGEAGGAPSPDHFVVA